MRVRMLSTAAGPDGVWPEMSKQDLPVAVALDLIRRGHAVGLERRQAPPAPETAITGPAEVAALDPAEKAILTPVEVAGKRKRKPANSDQ